MPESTATTLRRLRKQAKLAFAAAQQKMVEEKARYDGLESERSCAKRSYEQAAEALKEAAKKYRKAVEDCANFEKQAALSEIDETPTSDNIAPDKGFYEIEQIPPEKAARGIFWMWKFVKGLAGWN